MQLSYPPKGVQRRTTGRSMIKRTFESKGMDYVSEISLKNLRDLHYIIAWNIENNYKFFRIGSDLFPWAGEYKISELKDIEQIKHWLHSGRCYGKDTWYTFDITSGPLMYWYLINT